MAIIAQGTKELILGRTVYRLEPGHYTATPIELPVGSCVASASRSKPFLALLIDLSPRTLAEVATQLAGDLAPVKVDRHRAVFVGFASERMLEAALRLTDLFRHPGDSGVLGPLIVKEILYHLLRSPDGPAIYQFVHAGGKTQKIYAAIHALRSDLNREVDVGALAKSANMSRSAFFEHFKAVTAMSPIQYQKRLRLLEARRLMVDEAETAEGSAFQVGYKSASQFSREYSRLFGRAPRRDADQFVGERRLLADFA